MSSNLLTGAETVSKGVNWGAEKVNSWITCGSDRLKKNLTPEAEQRMVDPKLWKTAEVVRNVSGTAVKASGFLLDQVGRATTAFGKKVAPAIRKHGSNVIGGLTGQKKEVSDGQVATVMGVASGALRGASTIHMSLSNASATLATSLSDNTVNVVTHKYGPEYGSLTGNTLHAVRQTAQVKRNLSSFPCLGVKSIARRTAKDTGKALIGEYEKKNRAEPGKNAERQEVMEGVEEGVKVHEVEEKKKL